MHINKYSPVAFIYFFINALALPFGLTYTAILSPLLYWWVLRERQKDILLPFLAFVSPFIIIHFIQGVDSRSYIISIINYTAVYIFCQAFYTFLITADDKQKIFRQLLLTNFVICLVAIPIYFTSLDEILWTAQSITVGVENVKRLKMFTYEASYYAMLFAPIFFYFLLQLIFRLNKMNSWMILLMIILPFVLSYSIGVIACLVFAVTLTVIFYAKDFIKKKRFLNLGALTLTICVVSIAAGLLLFPANTFFTRLGNIFAGIDTSGNGRTSDAFYLAWQIIEQKSFAFGVGAGQVKILGADIIRSYYLYDPGYDKIAIPNAAAETMAVFGYTGVAIRLLAEMFFFMYTKVWQNYFRLILFLFVFLYQFTGSFITNIAEYVIWIMAFTKAFPAFDVYTDRVKIQKNLYAR